MRRVVVTGLGLITPLGNDVTSTWESLVAGRSGLGLISRFDASAYEFPIAAEVKGFNPAEVVDPKLARRIDLSSAFALAGAQQAVADARLDMSQEDAERVGVLLGTGMGSAHLIVEGQQVLDEKGHRRVSPFMISHMLPDTATGLVAIALGARGPNFAITAACATGGAAAGEAAEMVARGDCDVMIAGGFEAPLQPIYYAGFNAMKALAEHEDPTRAVRPFDMERNGFILGEGAGVLILEELEHARARGAHIYAEWRAAGTSNDAFDMV
ncbi:MAG: beta-ketoacyl-[acyl-carrier-protein] synthase II, partial [Chloroflexi bacterium]|nr:beta-ketoacyl-[acyl-carrier-protein] synthase II [Chloroflexota bacterium]